MVMSRNGYEYKYHFKDVKLEFLNGASVDFTLDDTDEWQTLALDGIDIITNYVNISVLSVYQDGDNGFTELAVFGHATGMDYSNAMTRHYCFYRF